MDRRTFLGAAGAGATAFYLTGCGSGASDPVEPLSKTNAGQVRGVLADGVYQFKGIRYGASTEGARRFMPPAKPEPWTGEFSALEYGPEAPQPHPHTEIPEVRATIPDHQVGEDCLRVNVWTRGLEADAKRPVMVWLHGGGYSSGNGGYTIYEGKNLAAKHDVVAVTVNHRLNVFGYLHLADMGGGTNVGMLDIVAALEWVRDNIANFGGDPSNVTIYGQSGGAGKVSTLLAMPSAKGLYHKAIVQSGSALTGVPKERAAEGAKAFFDKLGVKSVEEAQKLSMDQIIEASRGLQGVPMSPVLDGVTLPVDPFRPGAPEQSADVPLLIGSTEYEVTFFPNAEVDPIDDKRLLERVKIAAQANDADAKKLIEAYRAGRPGIENVDLALILESDSRFRPGVLTEAELKSAQPAPVYMYYFTWKTPVHEGKLKSLHTLEIPFVTANVDGAQSMTGEGQDRYPLQDAMSGAWAAFARTGNPHVEGVPEWPRFDTNTRATMIIDNTWKVVEDPNGAERKLLAEVRAKAQA